MNAPETYVVPGEIGVALMTNRSEFIESLLLRVSGGSSLEIPQQVELLRLIRDLIADRASSHARIQELEIRLSSIQDNFKGVEAALSEVRESLGGLK